MNRAMEALGGDVVKRYRLYERRIEPASDGDGGRLSEDDVELDRAIAGDLPRAPGRV